MYTKIENQVLTDLVTLEEAKAQLRLTDSFKLDDDYLTGLIGAAAELAQTYTNRMLSVGTVTSPIEQYTTQPIRLWGGEVTAITSLTGYDVDGVLVDVLDFKFNEFKQTLTLSEQCKHLTDMTVVYEAGYVVTPMKVKQGVLMLIATLYNNREDFLVGQKHDKLPFTSTVLLNSVREYYGA